MDRRKFIWLGSLFAGYPLLARGSDINGLPFDTDTLSTKNSLTSPMSISEQVYIPFSNKDNTPIIPPPLKKGSKVAITSPSSTTNVWELSGTIKMLKNLGLEVILGKSITEQKNQYRYLSAPDEIRAKEFNEFAGREDISAIIASRGGYGTMRIIDLIDFEKIQQYPKIYVGYSDFTFVLNAISRLCNLVTYHGPVGISSFSSFTKDSFVRTLFQSNQKEIEIKQKFTVLNPGNAKGKLIGGNLTLLASSLGTKYEFDSTDSILFIEEVAEHAYQVDRMLNQLKLAGKFEKVRGIIFGQFQNLNTRRPFYPNKGFSILEVISQVILPLKIPTIINFPIGHISEQVTLPLLASSELDTSKQILKIQNRI